MKHWNTPVLEVIESLGTSAREGLAPDEAARRLAKTGPNAYRQAKGESLASQVLRQFKDVSNIILLVAAALSFALAAREGSGFLEPLVIVAIIVLNMVLAVTQERGAERAFEALADLNSPTCLVLRGGSRIEIDTADVVPGDVLVLKTGDLVAADARLVEATGLAVDESSLTGESEAAEKDASALPEEDAAIGDRSNMVFSGCLVTAGNATAVVTATGMETEMGRIAGYLNETQRMQTPLQLRLVRVVRAISAVALAAAAILLATGLQQGEEFWAMVLAAVSLAVAAVPETLQLIVTLSLTQGVHNMVGKHALIRKLPAVETLGSVSVICSDKTGTLTQNRMSIRRMWAAAPYLPVSVPVAVDGAVEGVAELDLLHKLALASNAAIEPDGEGGSRIVGDATETAIVRLPFALAPAEELARRQEAHDSFAADALRVIALGSRVVEELPASGDLEELERDLTFEGIVGIIDPPRPEARDAIETARCAGIHTVMITGDHAATATAIARQIGLIGEKGSVVTGKQLVAMSDEELVANVRAYSVYARVSPEDKIRIVEAWQEQGEVVSMTGDSVNDAPALKAADVGVAMGAAGTEVAKAAADMILTDDNFATIVDAVREGRNVFSNIRRTVYFLISCNLSEIVVMLGAQLAGWGTALTPVMLLLINVLGDGIPGLCLAKDTSDERIMRRKPIGRTESFFSQLVVRATLQQTVAFAAVGLLAFWLGCFVEIPGAVAAGLGVGQTMCFFVVALSSVLHVFTVRSRGSVFTRAVGDNMPLVWSAVAMAAVFSLLVLAEPVGRVFGMVGLGWERWALSVALAVVPTLVAEVFKLWENRHETWLYRSRLVRHQSMGEE